VHLAKLVGSAGFSRVVAVKRMHRDLLQDPEFKEMFLDEARLAARISHPNVVPVLDVISHGNELVIVMDYVHGAALHVLMRTAKEDNQPISVKIGCAIIAEALHGLHAAHEARDEKGEPLDIVHRDVSPQNILVGSDGVARVLDFGIAKALYGHHQTIPGTIKGKLSYMAPEVIRGEETTRQADVFSAGVVFWEALTGKRLFGDPNEEARKLSILSGNYPSPRQVNPKVSMTLDLIVKKALEFDTRFRYRTALEFAIDIERAISVASHRVVSEWVHRLVPGTLEQRAQLIQRIESSDTPRPPSIAPPPPAALTLATATIRSDPLDSQPVATPVARSASVSRRPSRGVALSIAVATLAIIASAYSLTRPRPAARAGAAIAQKTVTSAAPTSAPSVVRGTTAQDPELPPTPTQAQIASSASVRPVTAPENAPGAQPHSKRAVLLRRTPSHSSSHAKPYLPDKL